MKKLNSVFAILILAISISACENKNSQPSDPNILPKPGESAVKKTSCEEFLAKLPESYFKGTVEVPENYSKPDGIKIKVAYYGRLIEGQTPTVFFNGGPGGASWSSYMGLSSVKPKDWANTSFVYIDQRGNGCSDPYPEYTGELTDEMLERFQHYGSTSIVRDAEVVRLKVWGHKPWKVFGQSYGAYVVHRYMVVAPEGVLSAHAHANTINSSAFERMTNRIGSQGRVINEFLKRFPEDLKPLQVLGKGLNRNSCVHSDDGSKKACGFELTEALVTRLGFTNRDNWFSIHTWVNYLVKGDSIDLVRLKEFADITVFTEEKDGPGRETAQTVLAIVDRGILSREFGLNYPDCKAIFEELKKRSFGNPEEWPINECASTFQLKEEKSATETLEYTALAERILKLSKNDVLTLDAFEKSLKDYPHVPFYLYSGEYDTFVPKESFTEEVQRMGSRVKYHHFSGTGHEGFMAEPLVWQNLKSDE